MNTRTTTNTKLNTDLLEFIESGQHLPAAAADLATTGEAMNQKAARRVFADYQARRSTNTLRRQRAGLDLFARYLNEVAGIQPGDLGADPSAWRGVTWGLVDGFVKWALLEGYAVSSVNVRLSTVKTYCKLAARAGAISREEYAMIRTVSGYRRIEARHIDEKREDAGIATRRGLKKTEPVRLTRAQARALKRDHPDTPQGRRDRLMMHLFLDLGLRVGEVAGLQVSAFNLSGAELVFYREKVDKTQTLSLRGALLRAAKAYFAHDALPLGPLLRGSRKGGKLTTAGVAKRNITERVRVLGERVGIEGLSAHDCRHYWATNAARGGTPLDRLQDAGGWSSPAMPLRYIEAARIANEGVVFESDLDKRDGAG